MADGFNNARALRVLEILEDYRALQTHIRSQTGRYPNSKESGEGFVLLRRCASEEQRLAATGFDDRGFDPGNMPETDAQKVRLQQIILDASSRRFQAFKIFLRAATAARWIVGRQHVLQGQPPSSKSAEALRALDQKFNQELAAITDQHVFVRCREPDRAKGRWTVEDPSLQRVLAAIRTGGVGPVAGAAASPEPTETSETLHTPVSVEQA